MGRAGAVKSQSAMEYLMTYGWSILIIAVVLGVLFQLGVFSGTNFAPRAQPGSCKVFRTTGIASLQGVCTGQIPQYAAQFDGQSSQVVIPSSGSLTVNSLTFSAWIKILTPLSGTGQVVDNYGGTAVYASLWVSAGGVPALQVRDAASQQLVTSGTTSLADGSWHHVVATRGGSLFTVYADGAVAKQQTNTIVGNIANSYSIGIGHQLVGNAYPFNGLISNVQIYNTSLDANQISALYMKGIGSPPVDPYHIVGWWPLNGDTNDYGGNNGNGAPTNIIYTGSWTSGYSPP